MLNLPSPVVDYIYALTLETRSPAYLLVEKDGRLSNWGGQLTAYGVMNLQKGDYVGERVCFLEGIFPLDAPDLFLPCIQTENGLSADVHIFQGDEGDWVLLLNATLEESQRHLIQQKGNDLSLLQEKHSRILAQFLGKEVAESLLKSLLTAPVRAERRDVTILFAELCGFTNYSETNSPEEVCKTLNLYLSSMLQPLLDEAGMVDKILGNGVTACFGVFSTTESPAHHAVRAALRMIPAIRNVAKQQDLNRPILDIGIGIASGSAVLGILGSKERRTFSVIGYPVNLAEYLKNQTRGSEILIDENTFNQINDLQKQFLPITLLLDRMTAPVQIYSCILNDER